MNSSTTHEQLSASQTIDMSNSSGSSSFRRRRADGLRVSFGDDVEQWEVPDRDEFSKEERKQIWYNEKELRKLRKRLKKVLKGKVELDETEDCWRGLEYYQEQNRKNYKAPSKEEALLCSDMRAAMDSAEAYTIYLETMDADLVNSCFQ